MQFGNRFCENLADHLDRWRRYVDHLYRHRFRVGTPEYALLGGEVFHDAPFVLVPSRGTIRVEARNVAFRDCLHSQGIDLPDNEWNIRLEFRNARILAIEGDDIAAPLYHQTELSRTPRGDCLARIEIEDGKSFGTQLVTLRFNGLRAWLPEIATRRYGKRSLHVAEFTPAYLPPETWSRQFAARAAA